MATHPSILARESHGQRSLAGYSSQGCKELDMTERLSTHTLNVYYMKGAGPHRIATPSHPGQLETYRLLGPAPNFLGSLDLGQSPRGCLHSSQDLLSHDLLFFF